MAKYYDLNVRPEFGDRYFVVLLFNASPEWSSTQASKHTHALPGNKKGELNPPGD